MALGTSEEIGEESQAHKAAATRLVFPFGANAPSRVSRQTEIRSQRLPGIDRTDFVAYHSMDKMGYAFTPGKDCGYYSRKPRSFLESAIGSDTWMITGTRDALKRMIYKLVGVYVPAEVRDKSESYFVWGRRVARFQRPIELNALNWFARLLQEQNNFSFGFNSIRNKEVLNALRALRRKHVARTEA